MKVISAVSGFVLLLLLSGVNSFAGSNSLLSLRCGEGDQSTKIYLDGEYKGDCTDNLQLNLFLKAGKYKLRAVKTIGRDHEKTFEKAVTAVANSPKRIAITLSSSRLTAAGEIREAEKDLRRAERGNITAMRSVAQRYRKGWGLQKNNELARKWQKKATNATDIANAKSTMLSAQSGDLNAMGVMARYYDSGQGVAKNISKANYWRKKAKDTKEANLRAAKHKKEADLRAAKYKEEQRRLKREKEKQEREAKNLAYRNRRDRERLQKELDRLSFIGTIKYQMGRGDKKGMPITTFGPFYTVTALVSVIPNTFKRQQIQKELATLASAWAKPDSLLARVYLQQKIARNSSDNFVLATK